MNQEYRQRLHEYLQGAAQKGAHQVQGRLLDVEAKMATEKEQMLHTMIAKRLKRGSLEKHVLSFYGRSQKHEKHLTIGLRIGLWG